MSDTFKIHGHDDGIEKLGPHPDAAPLTPSDADPIKVFDVIIRTDHISPRAFFCTVAGNVHVTTLDGNERTIPVVANQIYPIAIQKLWAASTTATGVWGLK